MSTTTAPETNVAHEPTPQPRIQAWADDVARLIEELTEGPKRALHTLAALSKQIPDDGDQVQRLTILRGLLGRYQIDHDAWPASGVLAGKVPTADSARNLLAQVFQAIYREAVVAIVKERASADDIVARADFGHGGITPTFTSTILFGYADTLPDGHPATSWLTAEQILYDQGRPVLVLPIDKRDQAFWTRDRVVKATMAQSRNQREERANAQKLDKQEAERRERGRRLEKVTRGELEDAVAQAVEQVTTGK